MALDFHKAARQIERMASDLQGSWPRRRERLSLALQTMEQPLQRPTGPLSADGFRRRIEAAAARRVTWLVADSGGPAGLARRYPPPPPPADYATLATDGSQIEVDRHGPAHCFLINIGGALIRYGARPGAELFSQPHLYSRPEELAIADPQGGPREQPIEGALLGIKRTVMECLSLAERLRDIPKEVPVLGLLDGSLVLWELSGEQRFQSYVKDALLRDGLLRAFDDLEALSRARPLAFASYISRPRSTEVVNILRVAYCPHDGLEVHGCDHFCRAGGPGSKECNDVAQGLTDRDLFQEVLEPGERSATFASQSPIVVKEYGRHRVHFFYVNVGEEIARVELPQWVADDPAAVGLLHALLLDQCRKGRGYPVALQEAHERAVVTVADRRQFWGLVQASLAGKGLSNEGSEKARSKRIRAV